MIYNEGMKKLLSEIANCFLVAMFAADSIGIAIDLDHSNVNKVKIQSNISSGFVIRPVNTRRQHAKEW